MADRFTCEDVFRRLDDYVDRELSEDESARVREHLAVCAECAMEYRFEDQLLTTLKDKLRRLAVPPDLLGRVTRALHEKG